MGTIKRIFTGLTALAVLWCCTAAPPCAHAGNDPCARALDGFDPASLLLPELMAESYALRDFIRTCLPHAARSTGRPNSDFLASELHAVDRIYLQALRLTGGDYADALLIATLGTLTHKNIPFTFGLRVPLTSENDSVYTERTVRLPRILFCDTGGYGDADKLQHFFGSAYATLTADGEALPDLFGLFVEWGEGGVVEGETHDNRDVRANRLGQEFARRLQDNPSLLPSQMFHEWNSGHCGK